MRKIICIALVLIPLLLVACGTQPDQGEEPLVTIIETPVVTVLAGGGQTVVIEAATGIEHSFMLTTTRHQGNPPTPRQRTLVETDTIRVVTLRGVLVIYEVETTEMHIV